MRIATTLLLALATALPAWPQLIFFPSAASSKLYFPQLADGGAPVQKWATTLLLVNSSSITAGSVTVSFYDNNGQPLPLDFGSGAQATLAVDLPAGGTRTITSTGSAADLAVGWGVATSTVPITGTVLYEARQNGTPLWDVAAAGTGPTYLYSSFANPNLGVALANPNSASPIFLRVSATAQDGTAAGNTILQLAPNGHTTFNLGTAISGLPAGFEGTVTIASASVPRPFVAWTMNARDGLVSPLPPGEMRSPAPYDRIVADIVAELRVGGVGVLGDLSSLLGSNSAQMAQVATTIQYSIDSSSTISARYDASEHKIHVSSAMIETLGDSRSAIGFLFAHLATLAVQQQVGVPPHIVQALGGVPQMADTAGMIALVKTGFDPFGALDFYIRMMYAVGSGVPIDPGTVTEFSLTTSDISTRFTALVTNYGLGCGMVAAVTQDCQAMHQIWHPDINVSQVW
jgi:hypothetical protein